MTLRGKYVKGKEENKRQGRIMKNMKDEGTKGKNTNLDW
jgi:hypothetical protein